MRLQARSERGTHLTASWAWVLPGGEVECTNLTIARPTRAALGLHCRRAVAVASFENARRCDDEHVSSYFSYHQVDMTVNVTTNDGEETMLLTASMRWSLARAS